MMLCLLNILWHTLCNTRKLYFAKRPVYSLKKLKFFLGFYVLLSIFVTLLLTMLILAKPVAIVFTGYWWYGIVLIVLVERDLIDRIDGMYGMDGIDCMGLY